MKSATTNGPSATARPGLRDDFDPATYEQWRTAAEALLKGAPFEKKLLTQTYEGIEIRPIYNAADTESLPHLGQFPGFARQARGRRASGYRATEWEVSQELPYSTPDEFNRAALHDLERGQTELNILLDLATLAGRDPDQANEGEVGACGLSLATLADMQRAFANIDLRLVPLYFRAGPSALPLAALLFALAKKRGLAYRDLRGCIEVDPLGTLVWKGDLPTSLDLAYQEMASLTQFAAENAPRLQTVSVQGHPYHDGGADAVQELAFVLATAVDYIRALQTRGLSFETVAPHVRLSLSVGSNFFMEIAKFRAARLLWSQLAEVYSAPPEAGSVHIHARTSLWNKTLFDPYVNVLRGTTEAFSAVLGGCDGLHVGPFDEIFRVPDDFSRRIARNTQLILKEECDITKVIDPAGGSWYVEWLTDQVARRSWKLLQEIETAGGMAKALDQGIPQAKVAAAAQARRAAVAKRRDVIVGTNAYPNPREPKLPSRLPDYAGLARKRAADIKRARTEGAAADHTEVLSKLNILLESRPSKALTTAIDAVLAGATLGEISRTLRYFDSGAVTINPIRISRASLGYERLRLAADAYRTKTGQAPSVRQLNIGPSRLYRLRADWTSGFFQAGGFAVLADRDFADASEAAHAIAAETAPVAVITSTDDKYLDVVEPLARAVKQARPDIILLLAGAPKEHEAAWRAAGVDDFVNVSVNTQQVLEKLLTRIGVL